MRLEHLATRDFRNLAAADLDTSAQFVVLHGDNAQGKTNTLEAIYLLATLKPLRARRARDLARWGAGGCAVAGRVVQGGLARHYRIDLADGARKVTLDGETITEIATWFEGIRAIAFTPEDTALVTDEPRGRRRWLDRAAFTAQPLHLEVARTYRRVLAQKAAALRTDRPDPATLDVLDEQVARAGAVLAERRVRLLEELEPEVRRMHTEIVGVEAALTLRYRTDATGRGVEARAAALQERLDAVRSEEIRRQRTLVGPQTDEVLIELEGRPARTWGSQGQVRSIVLALKLGELVAARARGDCPLFLLDDVGSELDAPRTRRLVGLLEALGVQVFATTTDPAHLGDLPPGETRLVHVEGGGLHPDRGGG